MSKTTAVNSGYKHTANDYENEFSRQTCDTWMTTFKTISDQNNFNSMFVLHQNKSTLIMSIFDVLSIP